MKFLILAHILPLRGATERGHRQGCCLWEKHYEVQNRTVVRKSSIGGWHSKN